MHNAEKILEREKNVVCGVATNSALHIPSSVGVAFFAVVIPAAQLQPLKGAEAI